MTKRRFKMKIRDMIFEVTVRPLFKFFGWTVAGLKARRVFEEDSDGKGTSTTSGT
jgi:hypothetical protein